MHQTCSDTDQHQSDVEDFCKAARGPSVDGRHGGFDGAGREGRGRHVSFLWFFRWEWQQSEHMNSSSQCFDVQCVSAETDFVAVDSAPEKSKDMIMPYAVFEKQTAIADDDGKGPTYQP